jgi:TolB-like protein/DNA-binding winged helix-turn-helix (wHTH) protein
MIYRFGDYELDAQLYQLRRAGESVEVEPKVFDLLVYLIQQHDRVVSKDELLDKLWPGQVVSETALTQCVMAARKAVGDDGTRQHTIKTQHGRGYRFVAALAVPVASSELQVPSQEEVASSQYSVDSRQQEENQKATDEIGLESKFQSREAENQNSSFPSVQTLDSRRQTRDDSVSTRFWSHNSLLVTGLLLLVGIIVAVQHLSRPLPSPQPPIPSTQPALPLPDKPSIAVLPFVNMSGDPEQEYFSDGLTDDLTTNLSQISGLFVIARTSAFTYKGKAVKMQEISKELGVRYVLEGSVRKTDEQVRINAQLVDAVTGHHLWAERYDRPLQDIFALQDEIRQQIVAALQVEVTGAELERVGRVSTANLTAYDYYLRGIVYFQRYTKEMNRLSRQMCEKAIELDPQFAAAYALVAWTHFQDWLFQWSQDLQILEHAFAAAQKAVALNDSLPLAHATLGHMYLWKKQHDQAIAEHEKAVALGPSCALCYSELGNTLLYAGRPEEALGALEIERRLNPQEAVARAFRFGMAYRLLGRYNEALAACKKTLAHYPDHLGVHFVLALIYSETGREAEARAEVAEIRRISPQISLEGVRQRQAYKDPAETERELAALRKAGLK